MKKNITIALLAGLMGMVALPAMAAPDHYDRKHEYKSYKQQQKDFRKYGGDRHRYDQDYKRYERYDRDGRYGHYDDKRYRPVYQVRPDHQWRRGQVLDRSYRGQGHWVDYRQYPRLHAPAKNQRWVRVDNDYILVNTLSNVIVSILSGR